MAAVVLCVVVAGMKNRNVEEASVETDDTQEVVYDNGLEFVEETEETTEEEEPEETVEEEEPENIRALREYYNDNGLWESGRPLFADLTGDGNAEMIVAEKTGKKEQNRFLMDFDLAVYQYKNGGVEAIYRSEDKEGIYCLSVVGNEKCILKKNINVEYEGWESTTEISYEKIPLLDTENETADNEEYPNEEMEEFIKKSVLLLYKRAGSLVWSDGEKLENYQSILEQKEVFEEALKIGENAEETLLDYAAVYDEGDRCVFGVTEDEDRAYSVWAFHDGKMEELELFYPQKEFFFLYDDVWESKIYQFGKTQHYILELYGMEQWIQHKFCYEEGIARKIDDSRYFVKSENGKIKVNIEGYPYTAADSYGSNLLRIMNLADVFYYDHQYVEYGAEEVDISVLEQYENYHEILQKAEENLLKVKYIDEGQEFADYEVDRVELAYIRKAVNGTYYLNYKIYGKMDESSYSTHGNTSEVVKEPDADGKYANTVWACVVLNAAGNHLEIENQYSGEKGEQSETGLAIYYGPDRELRPSGKSKSELRALIEEKSGKNIVMGSWGCYGDYDGDGENEIFAFVADSPWPYLKNYILRSDSGLEDRKAEAVGCALWFSDGEQTVQVAELADGYCELSMDILQFGESMQCSLTRLKPNKYLSIDEVLSANGYATTVCTLENGNPHVIMQDENIRFYQKDDSREIGCYGPYGTRRADDSVIYKNGSYYWESDLAPVFD